MTTLEILETARAAKNSAALMSTEQRNAALINMAAAIVDDTKAILRANAADVEGAKHILSPSLLARLTLTEESVREMAESMREIAKFHDPLGVLPEETVRPNGLKISKVKVPLGVVAILYEARPNVTADAVALTVKSGNVCILRIGKEAYGSARAIVSAMNKGLKKAGVSRNLVNLIEDTTNDSINELLGAVGYVDLLIPRGGNSLINMCVENSKVPCIYTGMGICHVYVDETADLEMALNIIENAKCSRPSVCNAMEVCLVNKNIAEAFLPMLHNRLVENRNENKVVLKLDETAYGILCGKPNCKPAGDNDFDTEFLDYVMAVKVVDDVKAAVNHIACHGTGHSDCIVTENDKNAALFMRTVDSAVVYVNASTRFTDGGELGLGAEIGISTQKLHARGPMGVNELTTYKYIVKGDGQIRR